MNGIDLILMLIVAILVWCAVRQHRIDSHNSNRTKLRRIERYTVK